MIRARLWLLATVLLLIAAAATIWWQFSTDLAAAKDKAALGSTVINTPCGLIEYQQAGTGPALLAVHGSGGGFDQGMAFAAPLTERGIRVIAMSRFGYLRTPMPADASAEAQADAFVCLMDALEVPTAAVMGGSAGALSALQLAVRHPDRVSAQILLVPFGYKPPGEPNSVEPMAPWVEATMMRAIGSDFLFWSAMHLVRNRVIAPILATPPGLLATADPTELARINAMLEGILPVSARADTAASKTMSPVDLSRVRAPTLIISAQDDGYGTYDAAEYMAGQIKGAHFLGFETGGHIWIGHNYAVMAAIATLVTTPQVAVP